MIKTEVCTEDSCEVHNSVKESPHKILTAFLNTDWELGLI